MSAISRASFGFPLAAPVSLIALFSFLRVCGAFLARHVFMVWLASLLVPATSLHAHPHVFVDGGVDFVFSDDTQLASLRVTWLYDEFETLYILSTYGMSMTAKGGITEGDRVEIVRRRSIWPSDFDGSAHLTVDGAPVALNWPSDLDARLTDGRLQLTFQRSLETPVDLRGRATELAFYESTYFFAFSITQEPQLMGDAPDCDTRVVTFDPDAQDKELLATLAKLSREEIPDDENVGALFADRIAIQCV